MNELSPIQRAKRALSKQERLDLLRDTLETLKKEGYARAEVSVSEHGALHVVIDKGRAGPIDLKV